MAKTWTTQLVLFCQLYRNGLSDHLVKPINAIAYLVSLIDF